MDRSGRGAARPFVGIHVLVVDDDADARALLRTLLRYRGAIVTCATSAREALERLTRVKSNVVVCDIAMPDEDGYWFVRQVRGGGGRTLPIIAVTAFGQTHAPDRALVAGFDAHLRKPIDQTELTRLITAFVRPR